jgi:hypothetical protein
LPFAFGAAAFDFAADLAGVFFVVAAAFFAMSCSRTRRLLAEAPGGDRGCHLPEGGDIRVPGHVAPGREIRGPPGPRTASAPVPTLAGPDDRRRSRAPADAPAPRGRVL